MDPGYETMLWYLAYTDSLRKTVGEAQPAMGTTGRGNSLRRRLARWCGYAALRLSRWLLAEEMRDGAEHADGSQRHRAAFRL
jgi:hypothetical protein